MVFCRRGRRLRPLKRPTECFRFTGPLTGDIMKKLLTALLVSLVCLTSNAISSGQARSRDPVSKASNATCAIKFHTLSKYKGDRWSGVFRDREVAPALRALLKKDYGLLKESLQEVDYPDSLTFVDKKGVLTFEGGVKGLYTIMEAVL